MKHDLEAGWRLLGKQLARTAQRDKKRLNLARCQATNEQYLRLKTKPSNGENDMAQYTDKQIQERFEMAEAFAAKLYKQLLNECPQEIEDKFRMGEDREHFGVLLIAPGMQLEEGIYCVATSLEADVDLDLAPHDLVLERGLDFPYRVRLRTEVPEAENLVPKDAHMFPEPKSWEEIVQWVNALKAMGCVEGWEA